MTPSVRTQVSGGPGPATSAAPQPATRPAEAHAQQFEQTHVHEVYSSIAAHFSATRHKPWPQVVQFLSSLPVHALVADLGCGNGKYVMAAANLSNAPFMLAVDLCPQLCALAAEAVPNAQVVVADALRPPLRQGRFDAAVSIAVVHHLSTRARRVRAHVAMAELLRPGGTALIYVWAQERPVDTPSEEESSKTGRRRRVSKMSARTFETQDMLIPWHKRTRKVGAQSDKILGDWQEVHRRYYHIYRQGELEDELSAVPQLIVRRVYYDHQNWCAVVQRTVDDNTCD